MNLKELQISKFIVIDELIMRDIGLNANIILYELAREHNYWMKNGCEDGWFFSTIENIESATTLSKHQQQQAINKLIELGFIDVEYKGMPKKRYIKFNENGVLQWAKNLTTSGRKINPKWAKNLPTSGRKINPLEGEKLVIKNNERIMNKNDEIRRANNPTQQEIKELLDMAKDIK